MSDFQFTSDKRTNMLGGWSRNVRIGDQEYTCSVSRGRPVRIPFKPRGKNRGWKWNGTVYRCGAGGRYVWSDDVPGSIGCRGLLLAAGLIEPKDEVCDENN